jgi:hypothetical protein
MDTCPSPSQSPPQSSGPRVGVAVLAIVGVTSRSESPSPSAPA